MERGSEVCQASILTGVAGRALHKNIKRTDEHIPAKYINQNISFLWDLHNFVFNRHLVRQDWPVKVFKPHCNLSPGSSPFTVLLTILITTLLFNWVSVKEGLWWQHLPRDLLSTYI